MIPILQMRSLRIRASTLPQIIHEWGERELKYNYSLTHLYCNNYLIFLPAIHLMFWASITSTPQMAAALWLITLSSVLFFTMLQQNEAILPQAFVASCITGNSPRYSQEAQGTGCRAWSLPEPSQSGRVEECGSTSPLRGQDGGKGRLLWLLPERAKGDSKPAPVLLIPWDVLSSLKKKKVIFSTNPSILPLNHSCAA